ncbi:hypothetical protein GCM10009099_25680 [Caenispirillum bisanense]
MGICCAAAGAGTPAAATPSTSPASIAAANRLVMIPAPSIRSTTIMEPSDFHRPWRADRQPDGDQVRPADPPAGIAHGPPAPCPAARGQETPWEPSPSC